MSYRFLRSYKLMIGKKGQKDAIVIEPPMRIEFDIEKIVKPSRTKIPSKSITLHPLLDKLLSSRICDVCCMQDMSRKVMFCYARGILPRRILIIKAQTG